MNFSTLLAAISDADFVKVVEKIGNILERLSSLETEVKSHAVLAGVILAIAGFFGWRQVKSWIAEYGKKEAAKLSEKIASELASVIAANAAALKENEAKLAGYLSDAANGAASVREFVEQARLSGNSAIIWEVGENDIEFPGVNYLNFWVNFRTKFPNTPQVFVAESEPGEWVYAKVDERFPDRFRWAARSLSGLPIRHKTKIQWLALSQQPAMGRPAADFEPVTTLPAVVPMPEEGTKK
jgi:hypothetical protein